MDFPISVLFEAPTIRSCAALIAQEVGDLPGPGTGKTASARDFTHIVRMNTPKGSKTPFFLVAGMHGNVLNFRNLADLLGDDRPIFGLQARGLYGDSEPHTSIVEAARDYIAEMRRVAPKAPISWAAIQAAASRPWRSPTSWNRKAKRSWA